MYTKIKTPNETLSFVSQQYELGTYVIVNNNPAMQFGADGNEKDFHINLRKKALRKNDLIVEGSYIPYNGKAPINDFHAE